MIHVLIIRQRLKCLARLYALLSLFLLERDAVWRYTGCTLDSCRVNKIMAEDVVADLLNELMNTLGTVVFGFFYSHTNNRRRKKNELYPDAREGSGTESGPCTNSF